MSIRHYDIGKQPKWVQEYVETLLMKLEERRLQLNEVRSLLAGDEGIMTDTRIMRYEDEDTMLPNGERVSFYFNGYEDRVDIDVVENGVEIYHYGGFGNLTIRPSSSNHLFLEVDRAT